MVENFDEEQIWQELELQNTAVLHHFEAAVSKAVTDDKLTLIEESEEEGEEEEDGGGGQNDEDDNEEEEEKEKGGDQRKDGGNPKTSASDDEDELYDEESDIDFDVDKLEKQSKHKKETEAKIAKSRTVSEVDDRFFKLSEMEAFLDDMDKREGKERAGEEIDYFQDLPSDEEDELAFDKPAASKSKKKVRCSDQEAPELTLVVALMS